MLDPQLLSLIRYRLVEMVNALSDEEIGRIVNRVLAEIVAEKVQRVGRP